MATTTIYPDSGDPAATAVDGDVRRNSGDSTWSAARDTADGTSANGVVDPQYVVAGRLNATPVYEVYRSFHHFDTSAIPDGDTISGATIDLYDVASSSGSDDIGVQAATTASNTTLAVGDYDAMTIDTPTEFATRVTSFTGSAYNSWTLNANGIAHISKTGVDKFVFRMARDIDNTTPPDTPRQYRGFSSADQAGTTQDPRLVITHAPSVPVWYLIIS